MATQKEVTEGLERVINQMAVEYQWTPEHLAFIKSMYMNHPKLNRFLLNCKGADDK